jgi:acyl-CoA synthetase (AMP-forming)/AMP-acid ligase II
MAAPRRRLRDRGIGSFFGDRGLEHANSSSREILPLGEVGEIQVRSYGVMRGYFDSPAATAVALEFDDGLTHSTYASRGACDENRAVKRHE